MATNQAVVTNSWDEATGRLLNTTVNKQNGTAAVDNITYTYNVAGGITSATNIHDGGTTAARDRQCYTYDYLQRLTNAWTDAGGVTIDNTKVGNTGGCTNSNPAVATFSGPAPYWQSFAYDLIGNRTSGISHAVAGGAASTATTNEAYTGLPTAHAVHTATTGT